MDDVKDLREAIGSLLSRMGNTVELVADGESVVEAYEGARREGVPFDAVILDLTEPEGPGGRETIKKLLEIDPSVRAIVMSGYNKDPVILDYACHGFKAAITKPFQMDTLREKLAAVMDQVSVCHPISNLGDVAVYEPRL